ncbi:MAG: hypothetical protein AB8H79_04315 [Myxococcota bacterium]
MLELTAEERAVLDKVPTDDLAEMAVELDLLLDAEHDRESLLMGCLSALMDRAEVEGLPLSKYDAEDLAELPPAHLEALGRHIGMKGRVTVRAVLRQGTKTWRQYKRDRPKSATALLVPLLLGVLARAALHRQQRA